MGGSEFLSRVARRINIVFLFSTMTKSHDVLRLNTVDYHGTPGLADASGVLRQVDKAVRTQIKKLKDSTYDAAHLKAATEALLQLHRIAGKLK